MFEALDKALSGFYYTSTYGTYKRWHNWISDLIESLYNRELSIEQRSYLIKKHLQWQRIEDGKQKYFSKEIQEEKERHFKSKEFETELRSTLFKTKWAFEALTYQSPLAYKLNEDGYDYEVWDVLSHFGEYGYVYVESPFFSGCPFSFHPTGNCGCIMSDDISYSFGIRCRHLMWCEGWCEDDFELKEDGYYYGGNGEPSSILIYANHKGYFYMKLIVFKKQNNNETEEENIGELS